MGGIIQAVERGFPRKRSRIGVPLPDAVEQVRGPSWREPLRRRGGDLDPVLKIDPEIEKRQIERVRAVRARRDAAPGQGDGALRDACMRDRT